eukprot:g20687.t1
MKPTSKFSASRIITNHKGESARGSGGKKTCWTWRCTLHYSQSSLVGTRRLDLVSKSSSKKNKHARPNHNSPRAPPRPPPRGSPPSSFCNPTGVGATDGHDTRQHRREGCVGSKLTVCFVNCAKTSDELLRQYFLQQPGQRTDTVVGLDMEWKPTYQRGFQSNPVALVQVWNESLALLLRVRCFKSLPPALVELLQHPQLLKAGVGVHEDVRKLQSSFPVDLIAYSTERTKAT